jgi:hypothetical protein
MNCRPGSLLSYPLARSCRLQPTALLSTAVCTRPIARGLPGPALLAHVMVSKYCDHQPLYRQSGVFAGDGVELAHSLLAKWVAQGDDLFDPLVAAVRRYVMASDKVHGDDTPVKVLAPGAGKTRTGRCGCTCATTGLLATRRRGPPGSPTRPNAAASIPKR